MNVLKALKPDHDPNLPDSYYDIALIKVPEEKLDRTTKYLEKMRNAPKMNADQI